LTRHYSVQITGQSQSLYCERSAAAATADDDDDDDALYSA